MDTPVKKNTRTEVEAAERKVVRCAMDWWRGDPEDMNTELKLREACADYDLAKTRLARAKEDARR